MLKDIVVVEQSLFKVRILPRERESQFVLWNIPFVGVLRLENFLR